MGKTAPEGVDQLPPGGATITVVALNGADDKPDLSTLRAFLVTNGQGVSYHAGIWREWAQHMHVDVRNIQLTIRPRHVDC